MNNKAPPLDFYQKPRDEAPSVAKADAKQVEDWSAETEIGQGGAAASTGGRWIVVAATFAQRERGYPAEIASADKGFAVQVAGLAGEPEARALAAGVSSVPGVSARSIHESARRR